MELLSGETLEERMTRLRGERLAVMDWLLCVLEPLAAAHAQGIVHRDLKPANVFIACAADGTERVKLLDFGLARDTRQKSGTETGIALGTPYYMSPEQATRPKHVGPASDIWSMGVMMYEVLSGQMPFDGETLHAVVIHSTTTPHMPLEEREPALDPQLCTLVDDCLSKDPTRRPADANELLLRLQPLLENPHLRLALEQPVVMHDPGHASTMRTEQSSPFADTEISFPPRLLESDMRPMPQRRSSPSGLMTGVLALVLLAAATLFWALQWVDSEPRRAPRKLPPSQVAVPAAPVVAPIAGSASAKPATSRPAHPPPSAARATAPAAKPVVKPAAAVAPVAAKTAEPPKLEAAAPPDTISAAPTTEAPVTVEPPVEAPVEDMPSFGADLPPPEPGAAEPEPPVTEPAPQQAAPVP
jgi:serine/threonine protein kinase